MGLSLVVPHSPMADRLLDHFLVTSLPPERFCPGPAPARPPRTHEAASDPDTHAGILLVLAEEHPRQVLDNPILPLLGLENPLGLLQITTAARIPLATSRIEGAVEGASTAVLRAFALDCAMRVLPLWEQRYPRASHLRAEIERARASGSFPVSPWLPTSEVARHLRPPTWEQQRMLFDRAIRQACSHVLDGSPVDDAALVLIRALESTRTRNPGALRRLALDVAWATASAAVRDEDDETPRADEMDWLAAHIEALREVAGG